MKNRKPSESIRCFLAIVITTAAIVIIDAVTRAFFYEESLRISPYLPLLIGTIALCLTAATMTNRNKEDANKTPVDTGKARRVRVTGPIK